jgi:fatty acid desaturase
MIAAIAMFVLGLLFFAALAWVAYIVLVPVLGVLIGLPLGIYRHHKLKKAGLLPPWPGHRPGEEPTNEQQPE